MKPKVEKFVPLDLSDNALGTQINKKNRALAQKMLETAKEQEAEKIKKGAVWMSKDKTSVLVDKSRIKEYQLKGYKFKNAKK